MGFFDELLRELLTGENSLKSQLMEYWHNCERDTNTARDIARSNRSDSRQVLVCKAFMLYINFYGGFKELSPGIPRYLQEHRQDNPFLVFVALLVCVYDMTVPAAKAILRLLNNNNAFISCLKNWKEFHSEEKLKQELLFQCKLIRANNQIQEAEEKERVDALIEQYKNLSSKEIEKLIEETSASKYSYEGKALNGLLIEAKEREEKEKRENRKNAESLALEKLRNTYGGCTYDDLLRYQQFLTDPFEKAASQILLAEKLEEKRKKLSGEINQQYRNASLESLIHAEAMAVDPVEKELLSAILDERKQVNISEFMRIKYDNLSLKELVKEASRANLLPLEKDYLARLLSQKMK